MLAWLLLGDHLCFFPGTCPIFSRGFQAPWHEVLCLTLPQVPCFCAGRYFLHCSLRTMSLPGYIVQSANYVLVPVKENTKWKMLFMWEFSHGAKQEGAESQNSLLEVSALSLNLLASIVGLLWGSIKGSISRSNLWNCKILCYIRHYYSSLFFTRIEMLKRVGHLGKSTEHVFEI